MPRTVDSLQRRDGELRQAIARIAVVGSVLALLGLAAIGDPDSLGRLASVLLVVALETFLAVAVYLAIRARPAPSTLRRAAALVGDTATVAALMHFQGPLGASLYVVLMWLTLDHGLRYGARWMVAAAVAGSVGFFIVTRTTPFWDAHPTMAASLLIALLSMPAYLSALLRAMVAPAAVVHGVEAPQPRAESVVPVAAIETVRAGANAPDPGIPVATSDNIDALVASVSNTAVGAASPPAAAGEMAGATPIRARPVLVSVKNDALPAVITGSKVIPFGDPFVRHRARVRPMRLLVAADQIAVRTLLLRVLERAGHATVVAERPEDALTVIAAGTVDAAVVDFSRTAEHSRDLVRQARVMEAGTRRTPLVVIASLAGSGDALEAGATATVVRPIEAATLLEALASAAGGEHPRNPAAVSASAESLDLAVLGELDELGLGREFVRMFATQCLHDASSCLDRAETAAKAGQWGLLHEECQALKGVAGNMGAKRIVMAASEIMALPSWRLAREWRARAPLISGEIARITEGLDRALARLDEQVEGMNERGLEG